MARPAATIAIVRQEAMTGAMWKLEAVNVTMSPNTQSGLPAVERNLLIVTIDQLPNQRVP